MWERQDISWQIQPHRRTCKHNGFNLVKAQLTVKSLYSTFIHTFAHSHRYKHMQHDNEMYHQSKGKLDKITFMFICQAYLSK